MIQKIMLLASAFVGGSAASAERWPIGVEREVDEGTYMQVVAVNSGWRIWRTEEKSGVYCKAVKSAKGRAHPEPIGVSSAMYKGTPFLEIFGGRGSEKLTYQWRTTYLSDVKIKYRTPGSEFWEERKNATFNADEIGEQQFEITLSSWEYPELYIGRSEETALFDLAGLSWAKDEVASCESRTLSK